MRPLLILFFTLLEAGAFGQFKVTGTVYDKTKYNPVEGVKILSSSGQYAETDSMGRYTIFVKETDSLSFYYNGKPTKNFAVNKIVRVDEFDISLAVEVPSKYKTLKEVIVQAKSFRQDSMENREAYARYFNEESGRAGTSITPGGGAGLDMDVFNFKKNKRLRAFRERLLKQEQEKYVAYRFNKRMITTATGLQGNELDDFIYYYTPSYEFIANASEMQLIEYTINAGRLYKRYKALQEKKPSTEK